MGTLDIAFGEALFGAGAVGDAIGSLLSKKPSDKRSALLARSVALGVALGEALHVVGAVGGDLKEVPAEKPTEKRSTFAGA